MNRFKLVAATLLLLLSGCFAFLATTAFADGQNGTTLSDTITATAHYTQTFQWTLDKSVTPATLDLFRGDSGNVQYTITLTKDVGTIASYIDGQICVTNGGAVATANLAITANLTMPPGSTVIASTSVDVSSTPVIAAGATACYFYQINLSSPVPGATYKVTSDVTITNHSGHLGTPFGPNEATTVVFPASTTPVNGSVNVDDTNGGSWLFSAGGSVSYSKTFKCDDDEGSNNNTATIRETGQNDSASVTVNCYALTVTKDATTSFTRNFDWGIVKTGAVDSTNPNQIDYTLAITKDAGHDSAWAVTGNITVSNPAPMAATLTGVTESISGATVNCPSLVVPAGSSLTCTYTAALPDASSFTNTATATLQNTPSGTTVFTGTAPVTFSSTPTTLVDDSVSLSDVLTCPAGLTCGAPSPALPATVNASQTLNYSVLVTVNNITSNCDSHFNIANTATLTETDRIDPSSASVDFYSGACPSTPLTIGYWKTHAGFTGNNADRVTQYLPITLGTPGGTKTVTVTSAAQAVKLLSFYGSNNVFDASNGINKLYAQLLAAKLNKANGAGTGTIDSTIAAADAFLATHDSTSWSGLSKTDKNNVLTWMSALDTYNNSGH